MHRYVQNILYNFSGIARVHTLLSVLANIVDYLRLFDFEV